jgi:hypothetical protein
VLKSPLIGLDDDDLHRARARPRRLAVRRLGRLGRSAPSRRFRDDRIVARPRRER